MARVGDVLVRCQNSSLARGPRELQAVGCHDTTGLRLSVIGGASKQAQTGTDLLQRRDGRSSHDSRLSRGSSRALLPLVPLGANELG